LQSDDVVVTENALFLSNQLLLGNAG